MASRSEKALVTGIQGFTGQHLKRQLLQAGFEVYGLVHGEPRDDHELRCDITDPAAVRAVFDSVRPDYIAHLAAISFVPHGDIAEIYRANLFGTLNLLDAVLAAGLRPRKILIASSANVYGNPTVEPIDESVCPAPVNHYANSKLAMEHMVRTYADRLSIVITRPFNYTGVGQADHFLIPKIVNHYRARRPLIELGNLDVVRDFTVVEFVVHAYQQLLVGEARSLTVNICSGQGVALTEVIGLLNEIAGYTIAVKVNPDFVRANEIKRLVGSNRRLLSVIGVHPAPGIRDILLAMYHAPPVPSV